MLTLVLAHPVLLVLLLGNINNPFGELLIWAPIGLQDDWQKLYAERPGKDSAGTNEKSRTPPASLTVYSQSGCEFWQFVKQLFSPRIEPIRDRKRQFYCSRVRIERVQSACS